MSNLMDSLYGPLSVKYCFYFYILSVIMFVTFLFVLGNILFKLVRQKTSDASNMLLQFNLLITVFIGYFSNRLMYSMCAGSLH